mmetsp:Transcript_1003/g.3142  ORF Transcript_1003/g.3142 Transcript_1003/m.3142 type:complete len:202 (-) Transcript_1003:1168-1773(-)
MLGSPSKPPSSRPQPTLPGSAQPVASSLLEVVVGDVGLTRRTGRSRQVAPPRQFVQPRQPHLATLRQWHFAALRPLALPRSCRPQGPLATTPRQYLATPLRHLGPLRHLATTPSWPLGPQRPLAPPPRSLAPPLPPPPAPRPLAPSRPILLLCPPAPPRPLATQRTFAPTWRSRSRFSPLLHAPARLAHSRPAHRPPPGQI